MRSGENASAGGTTTLVGQNVTVTGVIDSATFDATSRTVKKGLLSKKVTTTTNSSTSQAVVASTVSGDRVNVVATGGDVTIKGANVVSDNGTVVQATGNVTIGTLEARSSESQSVKVKKSGLSLSGAGLFAGVAKSTNASTLDTVTNTGSLVGAANGDVTVNAGAFGGRNPAGGTTGALTITGSQVAAPGTVNLIGESVRIENATDTANSTSLSKSSSFGVSLKLNSPLIAGIQAATSLAKTATSAGSARTQAVAGVAAGLAVANSVDAAKDAVGALKDIKSITSLGSVTASIGFSKSKSTSASTDQTVVGSQIAGGDVNIIARGAGDQSTINVIGSSVTATRDLTLSAPGAISFTSAQEIDTTTSKNKSVGVDIGVTLSASGLSPNASLNLGKGNSNGRDVTNIESVLSAGGTARVVTPGALTLEGAQLSANRVEVQAGSLAITSLQDSSTFRSSQTNVGIAVSADFGKSGSKGETAPNAGDGKGRSFGGAGASLSFGSTRQSGDFASVQEQSGISAGSGGFDIKVAGATTLTGAVIASTADAESSDGRNTASAAARNQLTTGTLSATDLTNREKFKASSINLSASISGIGRPTPATPPAGTGTNSTQVPANGQGEPTQGGNRTGTTAGLRTGLGVIAAGAPSVANASGSQSSTTVSAIATGGITVTSGDTASLGVAQTISRDTSAANEALTKQFTESKRADIAKGFAAAQALTQQVSVFFNNRAADQKEKRDEADAIRAQARDPNAKDGAGNVLTPVQRALLVIEADRLEGAADRLQTNFGGTSTARLIATAFSGAAGSNVSGSLGSLVQGAAVNVLQGLATNKIKDIADNLSGSPATREAARAALQAVVGCAGGAAGGSGNCGSAAAGAAASVVVNNLLNSISNRDTGTALTLEEQAARTNLVGTLIAAIAAGAGLDATAATNAAIIETENNDQATTKQGVTLLFARKGEAGPLADDLAKLPFGDPRRASYDAYVGLLGEDLGAINELLGLLQNNVPVDQALAQVRANQDATNDIIFNGLKLAGYGTFGFAKGFFVDGAGNLITGTLELAGNTIQFGADISLLGDAGDLLRNYIDIPKGLADELTPSSRRGQESAETIANIAGVIGTYAKERFNDPELVKKDVKAFIDRNKAAFNKAYAEAEAKGPEAVAELFGRIAGRAVFEAAALVVAPVKIVQGARTLATAGRVAKAAETAGDVAGAAKTLETARAAQAAQARTATKVEANATAKANDEAAALKPKPVPKPEVKPEPKPPVAEPKPSVEPTPPVAEPKPPIVKEAPLPPPPGVVAQQAKEDEFLATFKGRIMDAIETDGACGKGAIFCKLGAENELLSRTTLEQIEGAKIEVGQSIGTGVGSRIDNVISLGDRNAYVESKLTTAFRSNESLTRAANQLTNALADAAKTGNGSFVVLQVVRAPTKVETARLIKKIGQDAFNKIRIVTSQTELYNVVNAGLKAGK